MNSRKRSPELKIMEETRYEGNRSLLQVSQIANTHRMQMLVPPSIIIGMQGDKNKLIYTDPVTFKLKVELVRELSPTMISSFID